MLINSVFHIIDSVISIGDGFHLKPWFPLNKEWELTNLGIEDFDIYSY